MISPIYHQLICEPLAIDRMFREIGYCYQIDVRANKSCRICRRAFLFEQIAAT